MTTRLLTELPAILRWALAGLDRLHARGRFVQPQAGLAAHESLKNANSPIGEFIDEKCDIGPGKRVLIDDLYEEYRVWCYAQGRDHPGTKTSFGNAIHSALPDVQRLRETSGERAYFYMGVTLRGIDDDFFDLV